MTKNLLIIISISTSIFAQNMNDFAKEQMDGFKKEKSKFSTYKDNTYKEFQEYKTKQNKAFLEYQKELNSFWKNPKFSTNKAWVSYTKDKKTQTDVDFEKETIIIKTIANSKKFATQRLQNALKKVITIDTKTAYQNDPLEQRLAKIKKPIGMIDKPLKAEPILTTVIFEKMPTQAQIDSYVHKNTLNINVEKSTKIRHENIYSVAVVLPKNSMIKRSKLYYKDVKKQANKQNIPIPLVFAIMHSESSFNPRARSHVPAYGLMQIVPRTAGIDTYYYLYKKKRLVSGRYLYDSTNNITMGTAYLHILYYKYLKDIKNPDSRLFCTIAAYNTGAGNVAWAFTKTNNMKKAAPRINKLTPKQVYNRLLRDLKYDEPKHYLKKVSKRMAAYHKVYGF